MNSLKMKICDKHFFSHIQYFLQKMLNVMRFLKVVKNEISSMQMLN